MRKDLRWVLAVMLLLATCIGLVAVVSKGAGGPKMYPKKGNGTPNKEGPIAGDNAPEPARAIEVAKKETPLATVVRWEFTPPGPVKTVIYGKDKQDRELSVWVGYRYRGVVGRPVHPDVVVEHFVYMDQGISKEEAAKTVQEMGVPLGDIRSVVLDTHQDGGVRRVFWDVYLLHRKANGLAKHEMVYIDFPTGKVERRVVLADDVPFR